MKKYDELSEKEKHNFEEFLILTFEFSDDELAVIVLMLSLAVMISICHAVVRLPGYLSWNVPFDGADNRPITKELSSCIHALPVL